MSDKKMTTDAIEIIHNMFYKDNPERLASLEEERANSEIALLVHDMREEAGLSYKELADLVGTTPSVIEFLEETDYDGNMFGMLWRIATALNKKVRIEITPMDESKNEIDSKITSKQKLTAL